MTNSEIYGQAIAMVEYGNEFARVLKTSIYAQYQSFEAGHWKSSWEKYSKEMKAQHRSVSQNTPKETFHVSGNTSENERILYRAEGVKEDEKKPISHYALYKHTYSLIFGNHMRTPTRINN